MKSLSQQVEFLINSSIKYELTFLINNQRFCCQNAIMLQNNIYSIFVNGHLIIQT